MLKKAAVLIFAFSLIMTLFQSGPAYAEAAPLEAPKRVSVSIEETCFVINWENPAGIREFAKSVYDSYNGWVEYLVDWRVNNGPWHYDLEIPGDKDILTFYPNIPIHFWGRLIDYDGSISPPRTKISKVFFGASYYTTLDEWLKKNNIEFRVRYIYGYWSDALGKSVNEHSAFSDSVFIGTSSPTGGLEPGPNISEWGTPDLPSFIEAPLGLELEPMTLDFRWRAPESVKAVTALDDSPFAVFDWKLNDGEWKDGLKELTDPEFGDFTVLSSHLNPDEKGYYNVSLSRKALKIPPGTPLKQWLVNKTCYFRVRYVLWVPAENDFKEIISPYSNTVVLKLVSTVPKTPGSENPKAYEGASSWAVAELDRASDYGFITDKIRGKMNAPITREELCEVIMRMYEKIKGEAKPFDVGYFNDTTNKEIYKAYKLGIINGIGNGKFAPRELTNREQVASMMYRAVKVVNPNADLSTLSAEKFTDEMLVSSWALESVKFMTKNALIKGDNGKIDPKGTTTREQAVLIVLRTYEKYSR